MKRNLRKKLCAAVFFCAFVCGISAAPVLAITLSGEVMTVSSTGEEGTVPDAAITLFDKEDNPIAETTSDNNGAFLIDVEGDELPDVYFLTTKADFVDTYTQGYHFVADEDELELPLLPLEETEKVIDSVEGVRPVDESEGIIAGVVEVLYDGDYTPLAGVRVKATDGLGNDILCDELYLNEEQEWDPTLEQTSETGVFALYNIAMPEAPPQNFVLTLVGADPKYFFVVTGGKVFPYKPDDASPESITVVYMIGWEPGAGEDIPIDDGGGGGGCFVSGVSP